MTLAEVASPFQPQSSATRTRVGPSASRRASWSASGEDSAADGIGVRPSSNAVTPVCGMRCESVPAERMRNARRAGADRRRRAVVADAAAVAVVVAIAELLHAVIDERDLAGQRARGRGLQRGEVGKAHDIAFHRAAGAAAKRRQHERLRMDAEHLGMFAAAFPLRERHRLGPDLVETQLLELRHRPLHGTRIGLAARQARPDFGGQRLDHLPAGVVGQCAFAQLRRRRQRRLGNSRLLRRVGGKTGERSEQQRGKAHGVSVAGKKEAASLQRAASSNACNKSRGAPQETSRTSGIPTRCRAASV